jgi:hypothetical protein
MFSTRRHLRRAAAILAFAVALIGWATCEAGLYIGVESATFTPGATGAFDVYLVNNDTNPYYVASDVVQVFTAGLTGVTFTDANIFTADPYIYITSGTIGPPSVPLAVTSLPGTSVTVSDSEFGAPYYREVDPGATFGLAHVSYSVDANAPSHQSGLVLVSAEGTSLADQSGSPINFSVVPEPVTIDIWILAAGIFLLMGEITRRTSRRKFHDTPCEVESCSKTES